MNNGNILELVFTLGGNMENLIILANVAFAAAGGAEPAPGGGLIAMLISFLPLVAIIALMYFMMIRPQRKQEKQRKEELEAMKVGDNIITVGGVVGRVVNMKDDEITISTSVANTVLTFRKAAVDKVIKPISDDA